MSCNCKTTSKSCEPCAFCTPPGVTCLTTCEPIDPCGDISKVDLCCVLYSGNDHPCSDITHNQPLCEILIQVLAVLFPPEYCCALSGVLTVVTTTTTVAPTTTTTSSTTTTTSTTSTTTTTTTSTTTTTTTLPPLSIAGFLAENICLVQKGSNPMKLAITDFNANTIPGYTAVGLESISVCSNSPAGCDDYLLSSTSYPTPPSNVPYPGLSLPYNTVSLNIHDYPSPGFQVKTGLTTYPYSGYMLFRVFVTDGTNIYLVTARLDIPGWNPSISSTCGGFKNCCQTKPYFFIPISIQLYEN